MSNQGWIRVHRQIQDCWIWDGKYDQGRAWIDLLLLANHREKKISIDHELVIIKRGQFHTSLKKLADRWQWDKRTVGKYLDLLEKDGMIKQVRSERGTTLTIVNYDIFQGECTTECTTDSTTECTTDAPHHVPKQEIKNVKNEKNERNNKEFYPDNWELNQSFLDYIKMRKDIKKPMSDRAITLAMNKLEELSGGDDETAIQILEQSIFHSWQGLFELKNEPKKVPQYKQFAHRDDGLTDLERELISN